MSKVFVTLKDTGALYEAIRNQVDKELADMDEDEREAVQEVRQEKYNSVASEWFEYSEYLTIEIDTDTRSCRIVPVKELEASRS